VGVRRAPWTYVLGISVLAFLVWLVLDAPTLQHNARVSPVGTRRTVSLDVLGPLASLSRDLQLSHIVSIGNGVLGRSGNIPGNGVLTVAPKAHATTTLHAAPTAPPATTSTTLPATEDPTPANPLHVLVVGDSLGVDLGSTLVNDLAKTNVVLAALDGQVDTGLTRSDYYNWPVELQADLPKYTPQVVVIMMGANDPQDFLGPPDVAYGSAQWNSMYAQRVGAFMTLARSAGARVIWVGLPPMQDPGRSAAMANIDNIDRLQAVKDHVTFVSSWRLLGTPQGQYTPYIVSGGQEINVRDPDGTHIAPAGAELLSQAVITAMRTDLLIPVPPA